MNEFGYGYTTRRPGGLAQAAVEELLRAECQRRDLIWAGLFVDAYAARGKPLRSRDGGWTLNCRLRRGDVVMFRETFDAFRTGADCQAQLEAWQARGVTAFSLDRATDSPAAFRQWCLSLHQLRAVEAVAVARATEQPIGKPPLGFRWAGRRGRRRLVPNPAELEVMREAFELRSRGLSRTEVATFLMLAGKRWPRTRRELSPSHARRAIAAYAALLERGVLAPT